MADSILNKMATGTRRIDLDGPSMREYFAKRRKPHRCRGILPAIPLELIGVTRLGYYSISVASSIQAPPVDSAWPRGLASSGRTGALVSMIPLTWGVDHLS